MKIRDLRVEYRKNPIGLDVSKPRFSWKIESELQNCMQTAYQIQVICKDMMVWDSQIVKSSTSVLVEYNGQKLKPLTEYCVRVTVWDNKGEVEYADTTFETGFLSSTEKKASFITDPADEGGKCSVFQKEFKLSGVIQNETGENAILSARLYVTAFGLYEVSINEQRVGDFYFTPGWTSYHKRLQYQTYDVTDLLDNTNCLKITAADGWYKGPYGFTLRENIYGDKKAVWAQLHIHYKDGSQEILCTDNSWRVNEGAIRYSQIYMGETLDTLYQPELSHKVEELSVDLSILTAQESEPVRITQLLTAKEVIITPRGERLIDFGQNFCGFARITVRAEQGRKITIRHAEVLDKDGNFYPDTLRQAKSIDTYICSGGEETFQPHFTFHGFRYICIEGIDEQELRLEDFVGCVLHTDMEETGRFVCSDSRITQLQSNISWGLRSNFLDVPTDCPQRDERLGWTGDAQVFCGTASYLRNTALFFSKWLHDLKAEQTSEYGVPHVIPNILGDQDGAAAWSDAATIIPWTVYQVFGDKRILEEQFESMKGWVDYITSKCGENGLWQTGYQYGDWLALDKEESADRTGATDKYFVANAYYAKSCEIVAEAAKVLGMTEIEQTYRKLLSDIKDRFREEYITRTGRLVSETQTGAILALYFGLAREKDCPRIFNNLVENIGVHKNHLATGFVGTPYLCHVLSENGRHDLAGTLLLQEDYPSWLYAVKKGATTIWERWNSIMPDGSFDVSGMNSLNHYSYGSVGDWMYRKIAGINQLEPGYKVFEVRPQLVKGITWAEASFESVYGCIESRIRCEDGKYTIQVTVPANTNAVIYLPEKDDVIKVGSGTYSYVYETTSNFHKLRFTMESTLQEIIAEPVAVEMMNQAVPGILDGPMIKFAYQMTLNEMNAYAAEMKPLFEAILDVLNQQPM